MWNEIRSSNKVYVEFQGILIRYEALSKDKIANNFYNWKI